MKRTREFDNILNECIERVLKGESVQACLAAYPEHAAELEPLLRTVLDTKKAAAILPRPEFRQQAGYEFQSAIRDMRPEKRGFFRWQMRWVAVVSIVIVILLAGSGTVAAASNSLPDNPLYPVKLATEDVRLALTPSVLGKAELYAEFADTRVAEIVRMADEGKVAQVEKATERMDKQLIAMANLALPAGGTETAADETPAAFMAAPAAEATPAPTQAPAPTIIVTAPTSTPAPVMAPALKAPVPAPETEGKANARELKPEATTNMDKTEKTKGQADLKTTVSKQAEKNTQELEEVLKRVPDSVKPSLKRAIDVAGKGYGEALKNMERK